MISAGAHLTILESVDSTNNYAMARVRTGLAKHGDAFFAKAQLSGKGQRGKSWVTDPGTNIILSLVLAPEPLQLHQSFQFSMAMALAVHDFFSRYAGEETYIKWPNDLYWRDRKAGGILIENIVGNQVKELLIVQPLQPFTSNQTAIQENSAWQWAIAGIGVNINQTVFPDQIRNAVSLKQITGKDWDVLTLTTELCGFVQKRYEQRMAGDHLLQAYNDCLFKKGQVVRFKKDSRVFEAAIKEVNLSGELVLAGAVEENVGFGSVEWLV